MLVDTSCIFSFSVLDEHGSVPGQGGGGRMWLLSGLGRWNRKAVE